MRTPSYEPLEHRHGSAVRLTAVGCVSLLLLAFVVLNVFGGLFVRIDSNEELTENIVQDLLVGIAIVGIAVLKTPNILRPPRLWSRMIPVALLACFVSGLLISWHCFTVHLRTHATDELRERQLQTINEKH